MLAVEVELVLRPRAVDDLELLGEAGEPRGLVEELEPVGAVLALVPAGAETELDPPAGDVARRRHDLRELGGMAEGGGGDERPEPEPLGARGERGHGRPGVERAAILEPLAHHGAVVVGAEERLEPVLLAGLRERDPLLPGHVLLPLDHQADAHGGERYSNGGATPGDAAGAARRRHLSSQARSLRKGGNRMTADQLKRKLRNFPTAKLQARLAV